MLARLFEAIRSGDYELVEAMIVDNNISPLQKYNDMTAIEVCFNAIKDSRGGNPVYQEILNNIIFPMADRFLIGGGKAFRGDNMLLDEQGKIKIVKRNAEIDDENVLHRKIGHDDHRLSPLYREAQMKEHLYRNRIK